MIERAGGYETEKGASAGFQLAWARVYGSDTAPCIPPRFQVQLQGGVPASLTAAKTGSGLDSGWVFSLDHRSFAPTSVQDYLIVSGRPVDFALPFGNLLCDPSGEALIDLRSSAPGVPFLVHRGRIPRDLTLLGVQAISIDPDGGLHLSNALFLDLIED